jgi:hypothetical protein
LLAIEAQRGYSARRSRACAANWHAPFVDAYPEELLDLQHALEDQFYAELAKPVAA